MFIDDLQKLLPAYRIIPITENEYDDVFELQQTNAYYFSCVQDQPVTYEEMLEDVAKLPPDTQREQKKYIGFYHNHVLEAVM